MLRKVNKYDALIFRSHTTPLYILTILFILGILKRPRMLVLSEFAVTPKINTIKSTLKYGFLKIILREMDLIFTFTSIYGDYIVEKCHLDARNVIPIILAINHKSKENYPRIVKSDKGYLLALGRTGRDYKTFSNAIGNLKSKIIVITDEKSINNIKFNENVEVKFNLPLDELYQYIEGARLIVIPLHESMTPTGIRMIYFAMERGKVVIISKTSGIEEYFSNYSDFEDVSVDVKNSVELEGKIIEFMHNPELLKELSNRSRLFSENHNTSEQYINKICHIIQERIDT